MLSVAAMSRRREVGEGVPKARARPRPRPRPAATGGGFGSLLAAHARVRKRRKTAPGTAPVDKDAKAAREVMWVPTIEELRQMAARVPARPNGVKAIKVAPVVRKSGFVTTPFLQKPTRHAGAWHSDEWLQSIDPPSCGLGNKLFMYCAYRLYSLFFRKRFAFHSSSWLASEYRLVRGVDYQGSKEVEELLDRQVIGVATHQIRSVMTMCTMYLQWSPLICVHARLVYSWCSNLVAGALAAAIKQYGKDDGGDGIEPSLVVHLRTGDIWGAHVQSADVRSGGFAFYAQPPVWFYGWLMRQSKRIGAPKTVVIVTEKVDSPYAQAVRIALEAEGGTVQLRSNSSLADFGLLLRATHLVTSVSTFSWWGAFLGNHKLRENIENGLCAVGTRRTVYAPLAGYFHPHSMHKSQCRFSFDDGSDGGCCDTFEFELRKNDLWRNTNAQRKEVLCFQTPAWFTDKYGDS